MATPIEPRLREPAAQEPRRNRPLRMAEVVADQLRGQILAGELSVVPQLDVLVNDYDVGLPAAREALRILETEGLITVRRGKIGGADVHMPTKQRVAYNLSLRLQARGTSIRDVGAALRQLEPVCAGMCAAREDRAAALVPRLRELNERQAKAIGNRLTTIKLIDEFHTLLVQGSGSETLVEVVGVLEHIWGSHVKATLEVDGIELAPEAMWRAGLKEHQMIVDAIEQGDQAQAAAIALRHLEGSHAYMSTVDDAGCVSAAVVHRRL